MHHILVVSGSLKMREKIALLLESFGEIKITNAAGVAEAKGLTSSALYDLVLIGPPFGDDQDAIHNESFRAQNKIDDLRRIDLAKHALMKNRAMSEPEAHRFIEKQAMDRRMTRRKIAEEILRAL